MAGVVPLDRGAILEEGDGSRKDEDRSRYLNEA